MTECRKKMKPDFGYRTVKGIFEPVEEEQKVIQMIREMIIEKNDIRTSIIVKKLQKKMDNKEIIFRKSKCIHYNLIDKIIKREHLRPTLQPLKIS